MSVLNIKALEVTGVGKSTKVIITLTDMRGAVLTGYTSDGTVIHRIKTRTDQNGDLSDDLVPNAEINPANTYYLVQLDDHYSIIEKGAGEESMLDCVATDLNPLESVLGVSLLENLLNVEITDLQDGDVLSYSASEMKWVNVPRSSL